MDVFSCFTSYLQNTRVLLTGHLTGGMQTVCELPVIFLGNEPCSCLLSKVGMERPEPIKVISSISLTFHFLYRCLCVLSVQGPLPQAWAYTKCVGLQ